MSNIECATCGLRPCDLPDEVDPEYVFESVGGEWYCQVDAPDDSIQSIQVLLSPNEEDEDQ